MNQISKWLLGFGLAMAWPASSAYVGQCNVEFVGSSTLHSFTGHLTNQPVKVLCLTNSAGEATLNTRIEIAPRQLTTHQPKRDVNMFQMFQADIFPKLVVVVTNASLAMAKLAPTNPPGAAGRLPVRFTFCGITKEVLTATSNPKPLAGGWEFDLESEISLRDFKLQPPGALFGAIAVHDLVKLKAHVKLQKEPP